MFWSGFNFYALPIRLLYLIVLAASALWLVLLRALRRRAMCFAAGALLAASVYAVLFYCVLHRTASDEHLFQFAASFSNELYREMLMNAFLYFPFGLALSVLIGPWAIPAAFLLSLGIETWQYFAGTGLAQGTDVLCNTLGCAVGALPGFIDRRIDERRGRQNSGKKEPGEP